MSMSEHSKQQYLESLKDLADHYISILEEIFGPRDPRFIFDKIEMIDDGPQTFFPDKYNIEGCRVNIEISRKPWELCSLSQGPWQVAHECVHLPDPGKFGTANILEEGLATWFQDNPEFHNEDVKRYIKNNGDKKLNYLEARELVRKYCPDILGAVKTLRSRKIRIRDIRVNNLASLLPLANEKDLERLCTLFEH